MPTVMRVGGYRFFFFSNEGQEPPHIHIESADGYAKFWLVPVALAMSVGYTARELRQLRELVDQHHQFLGEKWYEYFSS